MKQVTLWGLAVVVAASACSPSVPGAPGSAEVSVPAVGTQLSVKLWGEWVKPKKLAKGTKLVYAIRREATMPSLAYAVVAHSGTYEVEIGSSLGDFPKVNTQSLELRAKGLLAHVVYNNLAKDTAPVEATRYKSDGPEDVTVKSGSYPNCARFSMTEGSRTQTEWYASGIGLVKASLSDMQDGGKVTETLELSEITQPAQ